MHRIGLIGLDTSHVSAFAKLLNDPSNEHHLESARITVAFPGGSPDFALSRDRVEGFTKELREQYGVQIMARPEAVAEACDLLFIESVDGRVHLENLQRTISFRRPTFIDKPLATTLADAREIVRLASAADVPLMSCSSLRFAEGVQASLSTGRDDIVGCDVFGPMNEEATQPGLIWYGCHSVEMMVACMGVGCREVRCLRTEGHDSLTAVWGDGRVASIHGLRGAHGRFGLTVHRKGKVESIDCHAGKPYYVGLLTAILSSLPHGRSAVPAEEMLEVVAILEAANRSRSQGGSPVALA